MELWRFLLFCIQWRALAKCLLNQVQGWSCYLHISSYSVSSSVENHADYCVITHTDVMGVLCQQRSHCSRWDMWGNAPSFLRKCVTMISTRISVSVIQGHYPMTMLTAVTWKSIASLSVFFKVTREKFSLKSHCFFFFARQELNQADLHVCFSVYM